MLSLKSVLVAEMATAVLALGALFAVPASALPGDDSNCPEGTVPAPVQPAAGEGVTCNLDSLIRARAKADILTHDELVRLCADVRVRQLVNVRVAVGHPHMEVITPDGKTCGERKPPKPCDCPTPPVVGPPAPSPAPAPLPPAPAPVTVSSDLPVTH